MLSLQSFLRKGLSLGYVGRNHNLKDLKDSKTHLCSMFYCQKLEEQEVSPDATPRVGAGALVLKDS